MFLLSDPITFHVEISIGIKVGDGHPHMWGFLGEGGGGVELRLA